MKRLIIFLPLFVICSGCQKNEGFKLLYDQLNNYNHDLKFRVFEQDRYLERNLEDDFQKRKYDSLNKIQMKLVDSFEKNRFKDREKTIALRDSFNMKYKLGFKFESISRYENIPDSIFNKLMKTDILRIRQSFQERYMFSHGEL